MASDNVNSTTAEMTDAERRQAAMDKAKQINAQVKAETISRVTDIARRYGLDADKASAITTEIWDTFERTRIEIYRNSAHSNTANNG